ncbi:uncharacterized protein LOC111404903 [Olea europaea var. sylvestris]|uniref:uncharacterized protein LOC111404903 n=1 Tax=Olea europaea var. sylvestris TaxID=158386 RepID=UPI000C1D6F1F|nr:uncharacterized protein LOC111404903 [Olea europaea var. sylvestris]
MASSTTGRKEVTPTIATQLGAQMYKTRRNGKTTVMLSCAKPPDRRHRHCYNIHPSSLFITWKTTIEDHRAVAGWRFEFWWEPEVRFIWYGAITLEEDLLCTEVYRRWGEPVIQLRHNSRFTPSKVLGARVLGV